MMVQAKRKPRHRPAPLSAIARAMRKLAETDMSIVEKRDGDAVEFY